MDYKIHFYKANQAGFILGAVFLVTLTKGVGNANGQSVVIAVAPPVMVTPVVMSNDDVHDPTNRVSEVALGSGKIQPSSSKFSGTLGTGGSYLQPAVMSGSGSSVLRIDHPNFKLSGPLIEGFLPHRSDIDRSAGQKLLDLPVVCMFVPQKMPITPDDNSKYFSWGESSRPWTAVAEGRTLGGDPTSPADYQPRSGLIILKW